MKKTQEEIEKDKRMKYIIAILLTIAIAAFIGSLIVENKRLGFALNALSIMIILIMVW